MDDDEIRIILGDSESLADLYYATRFAVGVPVAYLETGGRRILLVGDLEYGRARAEARVDEIVSTNPYEKALVEAERSPTLPAVVDLYLKEHGPIGPDGSPPPLVAPASFALGYAESLRELGYEVKVRPDPYFPGRTVKTEEELAAITEVQGHAEEAMELAVGLLRGSRIREDVLWLNGVPLTAEKVRHEMQKFLLDRNCDASMIIVAGGDQGADPHSRGKGPLPANQTIIIDVFPHSSVSHYWGDMTRTFVRGKASAEVRKLYRDVVEAQELAFSMIKDGVDGNDVHNAVVKHFQDAGNVNGETNGRKTGFIHGTGHGVGLEIHEHPRLGRISSPLRAGQVVTVEPGLYYPGVGSVRLEDIVVVTEGEVRNLNRFPKVLEV